jgi:putative acetyltransferase
VDLIRDRGEALLELVAVDAVDAGVVVGHIMVSPITLAQHIGDRSGDMAGPADYAGHADYAGIAPLSVLPAQQGRGIGHALMVSAVKHCATKGVSALFLLGAPDYYRRFGFVSSHVGNEYGATDAFMHLELMPNVLDGIVGPARYVAAFDETGV